MDEAQKDGNEKIMRKIYVCPASDVSKDRLVVVLRDHADPPLTNGKMKM